MGNIASINFKPTKLNIQVNHNDRSIAPSYVLESGGLGIECNRNAQEASALRDNLVQNAMEVYYQRFRQKFQAKNYLWSAVVNLKDTSTMQDLERLVKHFKDKYGFQCYQIAIHRDEGHVDDEGVEHINHHAHLEFVTLDEHTGKNRMKAVSAFTLMNIQTETAEILKMNRGERKRDYIDEDGNLVKGTGRKRIEPRAYGRLMEQVKKERESLKEVSPYSEWSYKSALARYRNGVLGLLDELEERARKGERFGFGFSTFCSLYGLSIYRLKEATENDDDDVLAIMNFCLRFFKEEAESLLRHEEYLKQDKRELRQENQRFAEGYKEVVTALLDLADIIVPREERKPSLHLERNRKLTRKEITAFAKSLVGETRERWIVENKELRALGDLAHYTQEDYKALNALKDEGLSIEDLRNRIAELEKEAEKRSEELKGVKEKYKEYLSPYVVEFVVKNATNQYKDYLSPEQVAEQVEAKRLKDLGYLCTFAGMSNEDLPQNAHEALISLATSISDLRKDKREFEKGIKESFVELCDLAGGGEAYTLETAREKLRGRIEELVKSINALQEAQKSQENEQRDKTALENLQNENKTLNEQNGALRGENETLKGQNNALSLQGEQDKKTIGSLRGKIQELENALETAQNAPQSTEDIKEGEDTPKGLQAEYEALKGQYEAKDKEIADKDEKIAELQSENARLSNNVQTEALQTLMGEMYVLTQKLTKIDPEVAKLAEIDPEMVQGLVNWADSLLFDFPRLKDAVMELYERAIKEQAKKGKGGGGKGLL
ncbi:coiled-coil domain-containing protein [Helicobacter felis]|uniref:hypothetical protein n=1 Tax=Helicobacter felis TaxID=214 RepID=UPI0018F7EFC4|nr:hypothetical protein [Helicobacter felis]